MSRYWFFCHVSNSHANFHVSFQKKFYCLLHWIMLLLPWGSSCFLLSFPYVTWHENSPYIFCFHALGLMISRWRVRHWLFLLWRCFGFLFHHFILEATLLFVIFHLEIIAFLIAIFILAFIWSFFCDSIPTVFLDLSGFVWVITCWYIHTFFMPEVSSFVTVSHSGGAGVCCIGILCRGLFHILLEFLVMIVYSFGQISPKDYHESSQ